MSEELKLPWWSAPLRAIGVLLGLLTLSSVLMGGIIFVARFLDSSNTSNGGPAAVHIVTTPPSATSQDNARTRGPSSYGFDVLVNSPGRPAGVSFKSDPRGGRPPAGATAPPAEKEPPVGISVDEYRATVDSGKKVYLPNPKGECDLSGENASKSTSSLENCFAQRAAR